MGLFGFLTGDPAKKWVREPSLRLEVELRDAALCGVRLGSRPSGLSTLGPPSNADPTKKGFYSWGDLGLNAMAKQDLLTSFTFDLNEKDPYPDGTYYRGAFLLDGRPLPLTADSRRGDVVRLLGEPWHEYTDPDEDEIGLSMWYETRTLEWTFEFLPSGTLSAVVLASPPDLEEARTRTALKCGKPWPP